MQQHLENARKVAQLLDARFSFFGKKFGYDALIGLVPAVGDVITVLYSSYLIWIGFKMKIPFSALCAMVWNVLLDFGLGLVPVIGDIVDFFYTSNLKNFKILEKHAGKTINDTVLEGEKVM